MYAMSVFVVSGEIASLQNDYADGELAATDTRSHAKTWCLWIISFPALDKISSNCIS